MSYFPKSRVVVPIDFSPPSVNAIRTAIELAKSPECVHVLHVIPTTNPASPAGIWGGPDVDDVFVEKATGNLKRWLADTEIAGAQAVIRVGGAGQEISDFAKEIDADLIVIPSHGESGLTRTLIGSVAERVVRYSSCPTLVLRDQ